MKNNFCFIVVVYIFFSYNEMRVNVIVVVRACERAKEGVMERKMETKGTKKAMREARKERLQGM